jgi:PIN domain nuclease of toxin-antitoxin system
LGSRQYEAAFALGGFRNQRRTSGRRIGGLGNHPLELGLLVNRGQIQTYGTVESSIRGLLEDVTIRPITYEIAALAVQFPDDYPRDPADRLIGATTRAEGLTLITRDENIRRSRLIETVW